MEEQILPWWKRALRAAMGTLRSGFGLFGKPQDEVVATSPVQTQNSVQKTSPLKDEPVIEAAEMPVLQEEAVATNLYEESVEDIPQEKIERAGTVVMEPALEPVLEEEARVQVQAEEESAEPIAEVTEQEAELEIEATVPIREREQDAESEVVQEQESVHEVTMDKIEEPADDATLQEVLPAFQPEEKAPEIIPEPANEIEEITPLHEEAIPQPDSVNDEPYNSNTDSISAEITDKPEAVPENIEQVALESAATEITTKHAEIPTEIQASAEPEVSPVTVAAEVPAEHHPIRHAIKEDDDKSSPFSIIVSQVYEGPMDLLLDLIRKQDIDIYDIPIAKITEQFLAYVERLRASDMDMAGEFIYTASLLIHIKSKTLLPRAPSGPDDQYDDPRRELVERLLEHERFKNAAQMLQQKQILEDATWTNPGIREFKGDSGTEPELAADTVDLVRVFREILDRARNRPIINVEEDSVTVGQMIQFLGRRLNMEDRPIALRKLLAHTHSQRALVAMFLALLELVRLQAILLRQDSLFSEIFIKKSDGFDTVMTEGFLAARDDWN